MCTSIIHVWVEKSYVVFIMYLFLNKKITKINSFDLINTNFDYHKKYLCAA